MKMVSNNQVVDLGQCRPPKRLSISDLRIFPGRMAMRTTGDLAADDLAFWILTAMVSHQLICSEFVIGLNEYQPLKPTSGWWSMLIMTYEPLHWDAFFLLVSMRKLTEDCLLEVHWMACLPRFLDSMLGGKKGLRTIDTSQYKLYEKSHDQHNTTKKKPLWPHVCWLPLKNDYSWLLTWHQPHDFRSGALGWQGCLQPQLNSSARGWH